MKIYIVGSGGVGGYFGGLLAQAGKDVTFVARGEHYQSLKEKGLTVKSVSGNFAINPVQVVNSISNITSPELVLFSVKTYDTERAAKELANYVNEKTVIITFQNGVENDLQIKKFIKNCGVYPGVAYVISTRTAPGVVEQTGGLRRLFFGDRDNLGNEKLKNIEIFMKTIGIDANLSDDITLDLWKKFLFIVAFFGMTAVCRSTMGNVLTDPTTRYLYERSVQEAISVAKMLKVRVADDIFESVMQVSNNTSSDSKSSLLVDVEHKRRTEIETLHGTLVRFAYENHIDVPINQFIYGAIKLLS